MKSEGHIYMDIHDPITAYRFWTKVELQSPRDCWRWLAADDGHGYGAFGVAHGKVSKAYRAAYELTYGEIPEGNHILHICGNSPCVNPYHLRVGTWAENGIDRRANGEDPVGERRSNAKLSNAQAREIYARHHQHGERISQIARDFADRVSEAAVYAVVSGRSWRSVIDPSVNDDAKVIFENERRRIEWGGIQPHSPGPIAVAGLP